jgi:predicted amidohydrolase
VCNTHVVLNSEGDTAASYRKMQLYDVDVPGGPTMLESGFTHPGEPSDLVVCPSPAGALGVTVCYDMRFPELYTCLRSRGAEILTMPSAFMVKTGMAHWDVLLRARAIENQCYVIAAAQSGRHHDKRESYGHAMSECGRLGVLRLLQQMITMLLHVASLSPPSFALCPPSFSAYAFIFYAPLILPLPCLSFPSRS